MTTVKKRSTTKSGRTKKQEKPYVLITVSGGVADIAIGGHEADVDILDFDNLKESEPGIILSDREWKYLKENDPREYARLQLPESVKEARAGLMPSEETDASAINPLFQSDEELTILDNALSAAEEILHPLLANSSASEVTAAFKQHVAGHLGVEMSNLEEQGHVNDDPNDEPTQPTVYRALLELAQLVQAGNTEFDGLERRANEVLARINK